MAVLTIHSRLKGFQFLERLFGVTPTGIQAASVLDRVPVSVSLEAMIQLAALHVRHLVEFNRHAFLLKVRRFEMPGVELVTGRFHLMAELLNQSSHAYAYRVEAQGPRYESMTAELLIGTQAYDACFQKAHLQSHYRDRFNRICKDGQSKP